VLARRSVCRATWQIIWADERPVGGHEALHQLTHCEHERLEIEPDRDHHAEEDPADEAAALQADPHQLILLCAVRLRTMKSSPMTITPK